MTLECTACVKCGKPAVSFSGHLHRGDDTVMAGWCKPCADKYYNMSQDEFILHMAKEIKSPCIGCFGQWHQKHGLRERGR